jgi:hypothetical protein
MMTASSQQPAAKDPDPRSFHRKSERFTVHYLFPIINRFASMKGLFHFNGSIFLILVMFHLAKGSKPRVDLFPECDEWAKRGDCGVGGRPQ